MDNSKLPSVVVDSLFTAGLLLCLATVAVELLARRETDSRRGLSRYVLVGGIFNFLACISWSAPLLLEPLLLEKTTLRSLLMVLPQVLVAGLVWGGIGALSVRQSVRAYRRWKERRSRPTSVVEKDSNGNRG